MTGTDLKIIRPAAAEVLGPDVHPVTARTGEPFPFSRHLATLHTNTRTDTEMLEVWLKSHADGSPHTVRVYARVGRASWAGTDHGREPFPIR